MIQHLATTGMTRHILDKYQLRARKKFGQNFLVSEEVVEGILDAAGITKEDTVLEIGPGIGTMTTYLSQAADRVVSIEIDRSLEPVLAETLADCSNVRIIWEDVLKVDLRALYAELFPEEADGAPNGIDGESEGAAVPANRPRLKVVANLPYYVTTPIIMELLKEKDLFESVTLMVQKEVAERICAAAGSREFGAITLAVQYYAKPEIAMAVPAHCFFPRPKVDSSVLHLTAHEKPPVQTDEAFLFALIRASFNQRRKTLVNGLTHGMSAEGIRLGREQVTGALEAMGLSPDVRGEKLSLEEFASLAELLRGQI